MKLPAELLERSSLLLVRVANRFKARTIAELAAAGFTQHDYGVLAVLAEGPQAQSSIADALRVDQSQLVRILDALEDRRLVMRRSDLHDRRRHLVSLTAEG